MAFGICSDSVNIERGRVYPDILSIDDAANYLTISKYYLYMLVNKNAIPHARLGKRIVFRKIDLLDWVGSKVNCCVGDCAAEV